MDEAGILYGPVHTTCTEVRSDGGLLFYLGQEWNKSISLILKGRTTKQILKKDKHPIASQSCPSPVRVRDTNFQLVKMRWTYPNTTLMPKCKKIICGKRGHTPTCYLTVACKIRRRSTDDRCYEKLEQLSSEWLSETPEARNASLVRAFQGNLSIFSVSWRTTSLGAVSRRQYLFDVRWQPHNVWEKGQGFTFFYKHLFMNFLSITPVKASCLPIYCSRSSLDPVASYIKKNRSLRFASSSDPQVVFPSISLIAERQKKKKR